MFFGFNTFDPRNSPAVSSDQESYKSAFTASALGCVVIYLFVFSVADVAPADGHRGRC